MLYEVVITACEFAVSVGNNKKVKTNFGVDRSRRDIIHWGSRFRRGVSGGSSQIVLRFLKKVRKSA